MAPSLPKTYRAAVLDDKGTKLVLKDIDLKLPGPGQVLIKALACGVCHTDEFLRQGFLGNSFPRIPGHEVIGDIVAVGEGVTRVKEGERVGGPWHGGESPSCILIPRTPALGSRLARPDHAGANTPPSNVADVKVMITKHRPRWNLPVLPARDIPNL